MLPQLLLPEIRELIQERDEVTLRETVDQWLPADVALLLSNLTDEEDLAVIRLLRGPQRARIFEYLEPSIQQRILLALPDNEMGTLLTDIADDDRTALLETLTEAEQSRCLARLDAEQRSLAEALLQYSPGTVGRLMTPHYVSVRPHWTVQHVLDHIRQHGQDSETLNVVYVVDDHHCLIDDLRIRQL
ncbi:MAG TPA: CBS domain-containing protein, partial [Planctomycetaceae bacterium]|nr:CBS domain-containing protein [Planctomycetaceae bacterium]